MWETTRWLLGLMACLAVCSLSSLAEGAPRYVLAAPNKLRVETSENIFVECQDCSGPDPQTVTIRVLSYPTKSPTLTEQVVTLTSTNKFQSLSQIEIPAEDFKKDPDLKQYVYLHAQFPGQLLEKVVLVSFQSGYIFLQTDKTIYTPGSKVKYRVFAVTPGMDPIDADAGGFVNIEIQNPQGITLSFNTVSLKSGIKSAQYQIPTIARLGVWKVVAKFLDKPQETFSAEFEVQEYVLPSFEVKLLPEKSFFYVDSPRINVAITAKYLFGEVVKGQAYVVFGVIQNNEKKNFPNSLQRVLLGDGEGTAILKRQHINQTFPDINQLVGSAIYVAVSVLTESGSEIVDAEVRGIHIVTSPYTVHLKKTPKYFKPGMPLEVSVDVMNPDNTPASDVPVTVTAGSKTLDSTTDSNGNAKVSINTEETGGTQLHITAKTADRDLTDAKQSKATMTVASYRSSSKNYLHIGVEKPGNEIKVNLHFGGPVVGNRDITYLILSKGRIVEMENYRLRREAQRLMIVQVPVTKAMLPTFRIIAYYHVSDTEVVSDSVLVDVKDTCMGSLKIELDTTEAAYEPQDKVKLKVTGDPGATVGLVAVDKAVYVLNNKHRLTQKKVWGVMERYDTGCTPGGGSDSMGVFYDAGLLFVTNNAATLYRTDPKCPVSARRKRATTIGEARTTLVGQYTDMLQRKCCMDGIKDIPLSYDCQRRSEYIIDGPACVEAFMYCCTQLANQREASKKQDELHLARSDTLEDPDKTVLDLVSRTNFPESWLWTEIDLPDCTTSKCTSTTYIDPTGQDWALPDSITTWQLSGISLSSGYGICVSEPFEVIVKKKFFIDLRLPYSAVRGEQLQIKAILHNLKSQPITVYLYLMETDHVCSLASKAKKYRQKVEIGPKTSKAVPFIIIPMKEGKLPIEVKAVVGLDGDGVVKELLVVPMGVLTEEIKKLDLDPAKHNGLQKVFINNIIPKSNMVPTTSTYTDILVEVGNQLSSLMENSLSGTSMKTLIRAPYGCGEQNIATMTFPLIAATYLDKTSKWEDVGFDKRSEALDYIRQGYTSQLGYRHADGCFSVWEKSQNFQCSTWLTAYTAKVFAMARHLVGVEDNVLCGAIKWLILKTQQPDDGIFKEVGTVIHTEFVENLKNSEASMTAFTLIAMQEARPACAESTASLPEAIDIAVTYLKKSLPTLTNPYAVAMTSYALANENQLDKDFLYSFSSTERNHWKVDGSAVTTLEATGYALLALVKAKAFVEATPIVKWLNQQRGYYGEFRSTQTTMVVYQALSEYWSNVPEDPFDLDVEIRVAGRSRPLPTWKFTRENEYSTRSSQQKGIRALNVTVRGTGEAVISVKSLYYAQQKARTDDCEKYNLTVNLNLETPDADGDIYKLEINVFYKDKKKDATMTTLEINLPTGFEADEKDLKSLSTGVDHSISKYEIGKGSITIYMNKVSHVRPEEISFRIIQKIKVGVLQPAAVSVYEYYDQKPCVRFYHPERENGKILTLCHRDTVCICAEENCSKQKKDKITTEIRNQARFNMACQKEVHNKTEYVYKVRLERFQKGDSVDRYEMRIEDVIKEGADRDVLGKLSSFLSLPNCRDSLALEETKTYLIMGVADDLVRSDDKLKYEYVLGGRTWIEYWPSPEECRAPRSEYKQVCKAMERLVRNLRIIGCQDD